MSFRSGENSVEEIINQKKMIKELTRKSYGKKDTIPFLAETEPAIPRSILMGSGNKIRSVGGGDLTDPIIQNVKYHGNVSNATILVDASIANIHDMTLVGDIDIALINPPSDKKYQLIQIMIIQDSTGNRNVKWPQNLNGTPNISKKQNTLTLVTVITRDNGKNWFYRSTLGGVLGQTNLSILGLSDVNISGISNNQALIYNGITKKWQNKELKLSDIVIDDDVDFKHNRLYNIKRLTLSQENSSPAVNGAIYLAGKTIKARSKDTTGDVLVGYQSASIINSDTFHEDRIPDIPIGKIPKLTIGKIPEIPISKIADAGRSNEKTLRSVNGTVTWADGASSLTELSEYTKSVGNVASHLDVTLGMEIKRVGAILYNTPNKSGIAAYGGGTEKIKIIDESNPENYTTVTKQAVMNFYLDEINNTHKSIALSKLHSRKSDNTVLEVIGLSVPTIKMVDTKHYKNPSSTNETTICEISADAYADSLYYGGRIHHKTTPVQTSFVTIKMKASYGAIEYPSYSKTTIYGRNDRVYTGLQLSDRKYWVCLQKTTKGVAPGQKNADGRDVWYQITSYTLDKGIFEVVGRDFERSKFGTNATDKFRTLFRASVDDGLLVTNKFTIPKFMDEDKTKKTVTKLLGDVWIGSGEEDQIPNIWIASTTDFIGNTIKRVGLLQFDGHFDIDDENADMRGFYRNDNNDIIVRTGADKNEVNLSNLGSGGSVGSFNPASISVPLLPAHPGGEDDDEILGSSSHQWKKIYGRTIFVDKIAAIDPRGTGIDIGGPRDMIGFFGESPTARNSIQLLQPNARLNNVISKINEILDGSHGLFKVN